MHGVLPFYLCFIKGSYFLNVSNNCNFLVSYLHSIQANQTFLTRDMSVTLRSQNSTNTINKHEAELWIKESQLQSDLNPPLHYPLQIVGDIKVASQTA